MDLVVDVLEQLLHGAGAGRAYVLAQQAGIGVQLPVDPPSLKGQKMVNTKELVDAFEAIEKHDLKPATIICTVCGCVLRKESKKDDICSHLKELAEGMAEA